MILQRFPRLNYRVGLILLFSWTVFAAPLRAATARIDLTDPTPANAALRSALVPGWGQWYNSEPRKGALVGATTFLAAGASAWLFLKSGSTYNDYVTKGVPDDPLYDRYQKEHTGALVAVGVASVTYIYGIIDAYVTRRQQQYITGSSGPEFAMDQTGRMRAVYKVVF